MKKIITVEINVFSKRLVIILVYVSTNDNKEPMKDKFRKQLDELIEKIYQIEKKFS